MFQRKRYLFDRDNNRNFTVETGKSDRIHPMKQKKNNGKKKAGGRKLVEQAGLAMKHGFHLEASWILSLAMERRLRKMILRSGGSWPGAGDTLEQLVKKLKRLCLAQAGTEPDDRMPVELINRIRGWKNQRNEVLKDLTDIHVSPARLERLAEDGVRLYRELNRAAKSMKVTKPAPGVKSPG